MARPCARGQAPLIGLADLHAEILRFRAAPRRRAGVVPDADSPAGSTGHHATPSAQSGLGTARRASPADSASPSENAGSVPAPTAPPSGPLSIVPGRPSDADVPPSEGLPSEGLPSEGSPPDPPSSDDGTTGDAAADSTAGPADASSLPADEPSAGPDAPDETVADLVARAQAGEADAFGALYDRYLELVYRYIYYRVGGVALAEDLASETFLRALRRIDSFSWQGRDFAAWLVTIARNLIADHYKSGRYRLEITTEDILEAAPHQSADSPENQVLDALTNETLLEAVRTLNPEQQECIVLRFLQGLSVNETALIMGKNDGAIKALQYRAVRALARLLPEDKLR
jgi:RNA polymerase sigma-70 factor (ECF subfamily)